MAAFLGAGRARQDRAATDLFVPQNSPSSYIKISAFLTTLGCGLSMFPICADVIGRRSTPARPELRQSQGICR
jgi:hypothetical protein